MSKFLLRQNIFLAPLTTFGIGGKANLFVEVKRPDELVAAIEYAQKQNIPFTVFAGGSNVIFPDEGLTGLVIHIHGGTTTLDGNTMVVDAGVLLLDVIDRAIKQGLSGLEKLSGIPGA